jgi:antitoxin YefM
MSTEVSYSEARNNLASILDQVTDDCEIVTIKRRGHKDVALISASELSSMMETEYLFRSPKNAKRLEKALKRAEAGTTKSTTLADLKKDFGVK